VVELRVVGDRFSSAWTLERLAAVAVAAGEPRRAAALLGAAQALRDATGAPTPPVTRAERDTALTSARTALGAGEFAIEWERGRAMPPIEAAAYQPEERPQATSPRPDVLTPANSAGLSRRRRSPLSAREAEVAALIARGHTNRQIAARLFVSVRTVETHVANALAKLGLATRAELAVWAAERGLLGSTAANS
jgi:non-specific serine/threonine protein kinase